MTREKIFISHPYSDNPALRVKQADILCKKLVGEEDIFPLSPLHAFSFCESDDGIREDVMESCYRLIEASDKVYFYRYPEFPFLSEGQQEELNYAYHYTATHYRDPNYFISIKRPPLECLELS